MLQFVANVYLVYQVLSTVAIPVLAILIFCRLLRTVRRLTHGDLLTNLFLLIRN